MQDIEVAALADMLSQAKRVTVVPSYGMAVARAQHAVHQLSEILRDQGAKV